MKVLYQRLSLSSPEYVVIDSSEWAAITVPIQNVNIQGVLCTGFEEYALEEMPDGSVRLYFWHGPRWDYDDGTTLSGSHGHIWTFRPLFQDPLFEGAWNTDQTKETYFEPSDRAFSHPLAQIETRRGEWADFSMPTDTRLIKAGVTDVEWDRDFEDQPFLNARKDDRKEGWRGWTDGIPAEDIQSDGTVRSLRR